MEKRVLQVIKYLREYGITENDYKSRIVLAAPAYGAKNLLRVYMNGGSIGKIALDESEKTTGIKSNSYAHKHKGNIPDIVEMLDPESETDEETRLSAIISDEYLRYAKEATTTYSVKKDDTSDTERTVETMIMDFRNQKSGNAAIDMEMQYSARDHFGWTREKKEGHVYISEMEYKNKIWYNEGLFDDSADTKSPRVDIMILNDDGVGFVELKVDNKNCNNLRSHINHMNYILSHTDVFRADAERRISVLQKYGLLEEEMLPNLKKWNENKRIWCGILFVGNEGHLSEAKQIMAGFNDIIGEDIRCSFIGTDVVKEKKLNLASDSFVTGKVFQSEEYHGIF